MNKEQILKKLKQGGARITKTRSLLLDIFLSSREPLSAVSLRKILSDRGIAVNKTTVYRELAFLVDRGIVGATRVKSGILCYEFLLREHHHHLVCEICGKICDIQCKELEGKMKVLEKRVSKEGFTIRRHDLEFFGVCANCS